MPHISTHTQLHDELAVPFDVNVGASAAPGIATALVYRAAEDPLVGNGDLAVSHGSGSPTFAHALNVMVRLSGRKFRSTSREQLNRLNRSKTEAIWLSREIVENCRTKLEVEQPISFQT